MKIRFFFLAQVPKCLYRVRAGEALVDIALKFGTSWLQVFLFFDSPPFSFLHIHTHLVVSGFYLHQRSLYLCMCVCVCMFRVGTPTSAHAPTHTHTHSHTLPAPPPPLYTVVGAEQGPPAAGGSWSPWNYPGVVGFF